MSFEASGYVGTKVVAAATGGAVTVMKLINKDSTGEGAGADDGVAVIGFEVGDEVGMFDGLLVIGKGVGGAVGLEVGLPVGSFC